MVSAEHKSTSAIGIMDVEDFHIIGTDIIAVCFVETALRNPSPCPLVVRTLGWGKISPKAGVYVWRETIGEKNRFSKSSKNRSTEKESRCSDNYFEGSGHHLECIR